MTLRRLMISLIAGFMSVGANAALILTLEDSDGNVQTVTDANNDGVVTYFGGLGNWILNVTTGLSKPLLGDENTDVMDLGSVNVSGGIGGLTITLTDDGFNRTGGNWISAVGGTTTGNVTFDTFIGGNLVSTFSSTGLAFANSQSGGVAALGPYAMSLVARINHTRTGITSFDHYVQVPEPTSITLLGIGLLGLALARRKRA